MSELNQRIVVVGAGHAGGTIAALLRQWGWTGNITILGEEPYAPYQRPPLSKAWLTGESSADDLALRAPSYYVEHRIELRLGVRVEALDLANCAVVLASGKRVDYDTLVLATGARPRALSLPGAELENVLTLRSVADAQVMKAALGAGKRLAVIGGGYIGLEVAASARACGADAIVIEREPRLLARVACAALSEFFHNYHRCKGVEVVLDVHVVGIDGKDGRAVGVRCANGTSIPCDAVLIGIGAVPNDELARAAGLDCSNGVAVDLTGRTSNPTVYAVGDCSFRPLPIYNLHARMESVPSALEQARQAASALTGRPPPLGEVPWFWSDQYDLKLQIAGIPANVEETIIRGDVDGAAFAIFHLDAQRRVQAVEAVNAPAEFMGGRILIGSREPVEIDRLRDPSVPMKAVVRDAAPSEQT